MTAENFTDEAHALSEQDFIEKALSDMMGGWVPIAVYLRMYPDENINKIHKRVHQGGWKRRVHYSAPQGGSPWINLPAVKAWLEAAE